VVEVVGSGIIGGGGQITVTALVRCSIFHPTKTKQRERERQRSKPEI